MNSNPTKKQRDFHQWCRNYGCIASGFLNADSIHHIRGAKMKLKGVKNAGEWYVLPLSYWWHQDGDNRCAIHVNKNSFELATCSQKTHWLMLIADYEVQFGCKPMSENEYQIIVDRA